VRGITDSGENTVFRSGSYDLAANRKKSQTSSKGLGSLRMIFQTMKLIGDPPQTASPDLAQPGA
jgi:hypothetical protein